MRPLQICRASSARFEEPVPEDSDSVADVPAATEVPPPIETALTPSHARLGAEGVLRLRARHAEILARISERVPDATRGRAESAGRASKPRYLGHGWGGARRSQGYEAVSSRFGPSSVRDAVAAGAVASPGKLTCRLRIAVAAKAGTPPESGLPPPARRSRRRCRAGGGAGIISLCK